MPYGTISRLSLMANGSFITGLKDDNEACVTRGPGPFGNFDMSVYIKWFFDTDFTPLGGFNIFSFEYEIINDIIRTGDLWDSPAFTPKLADIRDGKANYTDRFGNVLTSNQGLVALFQDWFVGHTDYECMRATDKAFWEDDVTAWANRVMTPLFDSLVTPPLPSRPPTLGELFPPNDYKIRSGLALCQAHGMRWNLQLDANKIPVIVNQPLVGG